MGELDNINYKELVGQHLKILKNLQYKSGLFAASHKTKSKGYEKAWLRDNFYECIAFEVIGDFETIKKTYRAILDIFIRYEKKIDAAIAHKPTKPHDYLHARYNPETFDEYWEEWGNKQNDSIGSILFRIGELEERGIHIIQTDADKRIVQKLVDYLNSIQYWHDKDSGVWEENEEIHASSVGACLAGLKKISKLTYIKVSKELIEKGQETLNKLLPRESEKKFVDLALLTLIWPYDIVNSGQRDEILKNVRYHLVKKRGAIRYKNDRYFNKNPDGYSEEAEWTFGFSWLALIYNKIGNEKLAKKYEKKARDTINDRGEIPELYFSNSKKYNENSPLGWAESLFIVALYNINEKQGN